VLASFPRICASKSSQRVMSWLQWDISGQTHRTIREDPDTLRRIAILDHSLVQTVGYLVARVVHKPTEVPYQQSQNTLLVSDRNCKTTKMTPQIFLIGMRPICFNEYRRSARQRRARHLQCREESAREGPMPGTRQAPSFVRKKDNHAVSINFADRQFR
jgi:hypothetical protein